MSFAGKAVHKGEVHTTNKARISELMQMTTKRIFMNSTRDQYGAEYDNHLFEQYKLYVGMADQISARRALANTFFVGLHTVLISAFTALLKEGILAKSAIGYAPFVAVVLLCYVWWRLISSYRQLNSAKFTIIHELECLLPVAPYTAEWIALGEGKNERLYRPMTHIENWVPATFALMYVLLGLSLYLQQT
jgi:hypothetical protein